jgi:hypothetical protein
MLTLTFSGVVLFVFISFAAGYALGRIDLLVSRSGWTSQPSAAPANTLRSALKENAREKAKIEIDTGKYVGDIDTGGMQKTQQLALGKTTQTQDDISASVSKLAQLKGK